MEIIQQAIHSPILPLAATLACFHLGYLLYTKTGRISLFHPVLIGAIPLWALIHYTDLSYQAYFAGNNFLHFLLGPATVALAIPLYQQLQNIRALALPILFTLILGGGFAATSAVAIGWQLGADENILLTLATKSVTTPIAMGLSEKIGGIPALAAGIVAITGVIGAITGPVIFKLFAIKDERIQGFTLGLTAHAVGTARAFEISPIAGTMAGLGLSLTGATTALILPFVIRAL